MGGWHKRKLSRICWLSYMCLLSSSMRTTCADTIMEVVNKQSNLVSHILAFLNHGFTSFSQMSKKVKGLGSKNLWAVLRKFPTKCCRGFWAWLSTPQDSLSLSTILSSNLRCLLRRIGETSDKYATYAKSSRSRSIRIVSRSPYKETCRRRT